MQDVPTHHKASLYEMDSNEDEMRAGAQGLLDMAVDGAFGCRGLRWVNRVPSDQPNMTLDVRSLLNDTLNQRHSELKGLAYRISSVQSAENRTISVMSQLWWGSGRQSFFLPRPSMSRYVSYAK